MPAPLVVATLPYILAALGGGTLYAWATASDDEWSSSTAFNSRMRQIHVAMLQLNDLYAKCPQMHEKAHEGDLNAWRSFMVLWHKFYQETGKPFFGPSASVIAEARNFASSLSKWLEVYPAICGASLPTGLSPIPPPAPPKSTGWGSIIIGSVALATVGYVAASYLRKDSES